MEYLYQRHCASEACGIALHPLTSEAYCWLVVLYSSLERLRVFHLDFYSLALGSESLVPSGLTTVAALPRRIISCAKYVV